MTMREIPFKLEGHTVFYEKSDAAEGQKRRIAGVISTESRDRQQEIIIQKGLDFEPFITYGWFNDNHSKATDGVVGYPTKVQQFQKGEKLPNGKTANTNCTWAEGYLLAGTPRADAIWTLGQSLAKSGGGRGLGFSIEGTVHKRMGPGKRIVAKASVQNCAITNCPVNADSYVDMLAKSLTVMQRTSTPDEELLKALSMGAPPPGNAAVTGPVSGEGAGQILSPESLEDDVKDLTNRRRKKKKLTKSEALLMLRQHLPAEVPTETLEGIVDLAISNSRRQAA
jgi:hypothetical protein